MATRVPTRRQAMQMEGPIARWYVGTRNSARQLEEFRRQAARMTAAATGPDVLEVAPGPGFLAVEISRLGRFRVTGLDTSRTMVAIASEHARRSGVAADFRVGDAAHMPLQDATFDLVVCQAAFKNFGQPLHALQEMHRVLRPGGAAVIQDMNRNCTPADIAQEVRDAGVRRWTGFLMGRTLRGLRRRAYSVAEFRRLAEASAFGGCAVTTQGIGLEIVLRKAR